MKKQEIYVNLQGKTKEELTDLWEFLNNAGENQFRETINDFLDNYDGWIAYEFTDDVWQFSSSQSLNGKTEVTIEQLKEILQPMGTLQQQLQKAEAEVKRLQSLIEEENKPKIGDWCYFSYIEDFSEKLIGILKHIEEATEDEHEAFATEMGYNFFHAKKITNPELIKLLENECSTKN